MNPLTPSQVEGELLRLSALLEATTDELPKLAREAAIAEVEYKREHAQHLLQAEAKTVSDRDAMALLATAALLERRRITEALYDTAIERCRTIRAQLSAIQSIGANVRGQWSG